MAKGLVKTGDTGLSELDMDFLDKMNRAQSSRVYCGFPEAARNQRAVVLASLLEDTRPAARLERRLRSLSARVMTRVG